MRPVQRTEASGEWTGARLPQPTPGDTEQAGRAGGGRRGSCRAPSRGLSPERLWIQMHFSQEAVWDGTPPGMSC